MNTRAASGLGTQLLLRLFSRLGQVVIFHVRGIIYEDSGLKFASVTQ